MPLSAPIRISKIRNQLTTQSTNSPHTLLNLRIEIPRRSPPLLLITDLRGIRGMGMILPCREWVRPYPLPQHITPVDRTQLGKSHLNLAEIKGINQDQSAGVLRLHNAKGQRQNQLKTQVVGHTLSWSRLMRIIYTTHKAQEYPRVRGSSLRRRGFPHLGSSLPSQSIVITPSKLGLHISSRIKNHLSPVCNLTIITVCQRNRLLIGEQGWSHRIYRRAIRATSPQPHSQRVEGWTPQERSGLSSSHLPHSR